MIITGEYLLQVGSIRVKHIYPDDAKQLDGETSELENPEDYITVENESAGNEPTRE